MNKISKILESAEFLEASKEELRVLIALKEGAPESTEALAALCGISKARAGSALSFWREAGVISGAEPTITEEFEDKLRRGEIDEEPSEKVARDIRDNGLCGLLSECAALMKKSALSSIEIKKITALTTQYALSEEYVLTLAAHLAGKGKLTTTRLVDKALTLVGKEIDSCEALEEYIKQRESESVIEREFRKILGIIDRPLSEKEKTLFKKWSEEYGYFTEILTEAYDASVNAIGKRSLPYIDKILSSWYSAGCRTVSECRRKSEEERLEKEEAKRQKSSAAKKPAKEKPRYGSFDVGDAFKKALARSYGKDDKDRS